MIEIPAPVAVALFGAVAAIIGHQATRRGNAVKALEASLQRLEAEVTRLAGEVKTLRPRLRHALAYARTLQARLRARGEEPPQPPDEIVDEL
ncbi:hypothetical protein [Glutamicibacter sp. NPDC087583]|uniref:hypothetical protein n=1 Tax=Glutamicibacter sp. NPDC087583 TaxID=3363995 RepID=UPI00381D3EBA